jgi:hypothetical protein
LADAFDARLPGSARWLAGLSQQLYRCPSCLERLGPDRSSEGALLQAALAHDPNDSRSRQQLIQLIASRLRYTLHELPTGVLFGVDGATADECDELLAELEEFRALIAVADQSADYTQLVAECEHHYRAYERYLLERPTHRSYSRFLAEGGAE